MKSVLDKATRDELISRINSLNENSTPQWGKMNVYQMVKHCALWEEMLLGKKQYKQSFLGRLFGKIALKDMLKDQPVKPNLPTVPSLRLLIMATWLLPKPNGSACLSNMGHMQVVGLSILFSASLLRSRLAQSPTSISTITSVNSIAKQSAIDTRCL
jgi:hypothetical protein